MKKYYRCLLVVLILVSMVLPLSISMPVMADEFSIYGSTSDGYLKYTDGTYNTAWVAASAENLYDDPTESEWLVVGQRKPSDYEIYRMYLYFDTSGLPDDAVISSATIKLYGRLDLSTTDFDITLQDGTPTYPHDPLEVGDYDKSNYANDGGTLSTASFVEEAYNDITLNATGRGWISVTGTSKFCVRSSREIAGTSPTGNEYVFFYPADTTGTSKDPTLEVTYTSGTTYIQTDNATSIQSSSVTLNGEVLSLGGEDYGYCYFQYGTSTSYGGTTAGQNLTDTTTFDEDVEGLFYSTTYHFRACIVLDVNTFYGEDIEFTTLSASGSSTDIIISDIAVFTDYIEMDTQAWVTPDSYVDSGSDWSDEEEAYDDSVIGSAYSGAYTYTKDAYLELNVAEMECTAVRVRAAEVQYGFPSATTYNPDVNIDVYYDAGWHNIHSDTVTKDTWEEISVGGTETIAAMRIKSNSDDLYYTDPTDFRGLFVREVDFYGETGDWLICVEILNYYTNYYPDKGASRWFSVQLLDTDETTVLAASPLSNWGHRPSSIYLNGELASSLVYGEEYYIGVVGQNIPEEPSVTKQLTSADWYGYDLDSLDSWCINTAIKMEVSDGTSSYVTVLTDRGLTITDSAGGYFTKGIPGIAQVRPNLFTTSQLTPEELDTTDLSVWDSDDEWESYVGENIATDADTMATPFGVGGKDMLSGVIILGILGMMGLVVSATGGFGAFGGLLLSVPILWLGTYFRIIPVAIIVIMAIVFGGLAIRQFVVKTL